MFYLFEESPSRNKGFENKKIEELKVLVEEASCFVCMRVHSFSLFSGLQENQKKRRLIQKKSKLTHDDVAKIAVMFGMQCTAAPEPEKMAEGKTSSASASSGDAEAEDESEK